MAERIERPHAKAKVGQLEQQAGIIVEDVANLEDEQYLDHYRNSKIVICCGRGAYEDQMFHDTLVMKDILSSKNVNAWIDIWGPDVNHDWPWWYKQMNYFLGSLYH